MKNKMENAFPTAIRAAFEAGLEILKVYDLDFDVDYKKDQSPLTKADQLAHEKIVAHLKATDIPVLSEEGREIAYEERKKWERLWIVDPLDGTKEFVKRNGEFTVNIALIEHSKPVFGVIYVPVKDTLYFGVLNEGAYKIEQFCDASELNLDALRKTADMLPMHYDRPFTIIGSRSHMSEETMDYVNEKQKEHDQIEVVSAGSSLKLCMVAEGKADEYPRFAPTMEWDTAAGQAIVEASGGYVINWNTKQPMQYNRENLLNDWFLVAK